MSCLWLDVDANFINSVLGRTAIKGKYVNSAKHARVVCIPVRWKCSLAAVGFGKGKVLWDQQLFLFTVWSVVVSTVSQMLCRQSRQIQLL